MNEEALRGLLRGFKRGEVTERAALRQLKNLSFEVLPYARVDHHRALRQGFPEVIFCQGKTPDQIAGIAQRLVKAGHLLLATRATETDFRAVQAVLPAACYHDVARAITVGRPRKPRSRARGRSVLVVSAGTTDIPVSEEAVLTVEMMGHRVDRLFDVGVAGIHRLLHSVKELERAGVVIVTAGMEGALPSVVGGLTDRPVIAVPTSSGYGASFGGIAALLGMLNSCASGVTVVNIDNGFGAGFAAGLILRAQRR